MDRMDGAIQGVRNRIEVSELTAGDRMRRADEEKSLAIAIRSLWS